VNGLTGETELSRGHRGNKLLGVWLTIAQYSQFEEFLDKFSTGETFTE
jgi:hypothetical protein